MVKIKICLLVNKIRIKLLKNNLPQLIVCSEIPEIPEIAGKGEIYISFDDGQWCYLLMECPCGCGAYIDLSLARLDHCIWHESTYPVTYPSLSISPG